MTRIASALALLLACTGLAEANYVIIRMNLGSPPAKSELTTAPPVGPGGITNYRPLLKPAAKISATVAAPPKGSISVIVLLEYQKQRNIIDPFTNQPRADRIWIDHAWGKTVLAYDQQAVQAFPLWDEGFNKRKVARPTVGQVYDVRYKDMLYDKAASAAKFVDLADWALTNGLEAKLPDLLKQAADRNQAEPDPAVTKVLQAYDKVAKEMSQPLTRDENYLGAKGVEGLKVATSEHYTVYYDAPAGSTPEVEARLKKLEQTYRSFFWWFALRGKALPTPARRLVVLLIDRPSDFRQYHTSYSMPPMAADGFYSQRENVAVLSSLPLDLSYELASRHFRELAQSGWNLRAMLDPKLQFPRGKDQDQVCYAQTMALLQKVLHEESEWASITQTGTRQLLTATGLLPRTVTLPQWIQAGLTSFFETPKFNHESLTGAFWVTCGAPHWVYHPMWRDLETRGALEEPAEAMKYVITDRYFREARDANEQLKARTMAWSLAYFLAQRKLDGLLAYCHELGNLPRDLELDDDAYLACFTRGLGVAGPDGQGIDDAKFAALAQEWYKFVSIAPMPEVSQEAQKALADMKKKDAVPDQK